VVNVMAVFTLVSEQAELNFCSTGWQAWVLGACGFVGGAVGCVRSCLWSISAFVFWLFQATWRHVKSYGSVGLYQRTVSGGGCFGVCMGLCVGAALGLFQHCFLAVSGSLVSQLAALGAWSYVGGGFCRGRFQGLFRGLWELCVGATLRIQRCFLAISDSLVSQPGSPGCMSDRLAA
jgi:hypothetical protein